MVWRQYGDIISLPVLQTFRQSHINVCQFSRFMFRTIISCVYSNSLGYIQLLVHCTSREPSRLLQLSVMAVIFSDPKKVTKEEWLIIVYKPHSQYKIVHTHIASGYKDDEAHDDQTCCHLYAPLFDAKMVLPNITLYRHAHARLLSMRNYPSFYGSCLMETLFQNHE